MILFTQGYSFPEQPAATLSIPFAFPAWALNRYLWVSIAACHSVNGRNADPILWARVDGVDMYLWRLPESPNEGPGVVPTRCYMYLNDPNVEPALAGTLTIGVRGNASASPHNLVVHVSGISGGVYPGKNDDVIAAGATVAGLSLPQLFMPTPPFGGFVGVALRGNPTPPQVASMVGGVTQLAQMTAGSGFGSVRGAVWSGDDSGHYSPLFEFGASAAAYAFAFRGGAAEGVAPSPPPAAPPLPRARWEKRWWAFGLLPPHFAEEEDCR